MSSSVFCSCRFIFHVIVCLSDLPTCSEVLSCSLSPGCGLTVTVHLQWNSGDIQVTSLFLCARGKVDRKCEESSVFRQAFVLFCFVLFFSPKQTYSFLPGSLKSAWSVSTAPCSDLEENMCPPEQTEPGGRVIPVGREISGGWGQAAVFQCSCSGNGEQGWRRCECLLQNVPAYWVRSVFGASSLARLQLGLLVLTACVPVCNVFVCFRLLGFSLCKTFNPYLATLWLLWIMHR